MPIVRMPDGKKVRFPDNMSREDIKGFISQKYNQAPQFSADALAEVKANNEAYAQRQEEARPWVDKNPVARLGIAAMQGVANSGLNPAGYAARAAGMDTKPFTPQNAVERATELGAEYGYDAAALGGIGKLAQGAGYLGKGQSLTSKVAQEVLAPENTTALLSKFVAPAVGGGMLEGAANPQTEVGKTLANIAGAGIVGGIEGGFRRTATNTAGGLKEALPNESANAALSKGVRADKEIARQISKDAPAVYNSLNNDMSQALDKAVGRKLDIERALDSQQQRYNDFVSKNADVELYSPKSAQEQSADNFKRWFEGSKVVDEDGKPKTVFHRSPNKFDAFALDKRGSTSDDGLYGKGFYFADESLPHYGENEYEVFLNMKKPLELNKFKSAKELADFSGIDESWITRDSGGVFHPIDRMSGEFKDNLKDLGYDGVVIKHIPMGGGKESYEYVAFEPNQIKSVNNSGAWSSSPSLSDAGWKPKASLKNFTQGLSKDQTKVFNEVINEGADKVTNPKGSLRATHRALEVLNKKIDNTINENPLRPRAKGDPDVRDLMQVKERLNQILDLGGIKPYDAGISKAKSLRANFEEGYNFKPSETKFENLGLKTNRDKRAFLQGRLAKIKDNVLSDGGTNLATAVKKDENTLRKLMSKDKFDTLMNKANGIEESFKRLKSIEGQADRELVKDIERNGSPWRENTESKGSMYGRAADILTGWYGRNARKNLANAYLNPNINEIRQSGGLLGALKGMSAADTRQLMIDLLNGGN